MTRAATAISIKFWLPVLVFTLGVTVWGMMTWKEYDTLQQGLLNNSYQFLKHDLSLLKRELQTELLSGSAAEAEQAITIRGVNNRYTELALINDTGQVLYSTKFEHKNRPAIDVLPLFDSQLFEQVRSSARRNIIEQREQHRFIAYVPVVLEQNSNDALRSQKTGVVYLVYDFTVDFQEIWSELLQTSLLIALLIAIALAIFFGFHYVFIARPIDQLVATTRKIADGNYGVSSNIKGSGEIIELVQAFNDMSRQLQERSRQRDMAVQELNKKEHWQRHLLNTLPNGVQEMNTDGMITYSNPAHHQMLGLKPGELIGRYIWDFQPDEASKKEVINYLQYILDKQPEPSPFVTTNVTADGREVILEIIWDYQRDETGKITGFIAVLSDITERTKAEKALAASEKKYSTLFEKSVDAILLIEDNRFIDCNQAAMDMAGYNDKQALLDTHPSQLSPPYQPDGKSSFEKADEMIAIAFEKGSHRFRWIHTRKDGENFPVEVSLTAIPFGERNLLHVVWRDLTEKEQIEEALRRSQKMEAIGQLTGGIAHDFNNILGIIIGNLSLLEAGNELTPAIQKRIDTIKHSAERAVELTRQLLGFSANRATATELVDLNDVVEGLRSLIVQSLTPQIETEYQLYSSLWQTEINPGDFEDALLNLSLNARDAMNGRGRLTIETHNSILDEGYCKLNPGVLPGEYVQLTVSDNGEGIPREQQARIFEPFYTTKEKGKGTGLGLAMVFGFVKRSGGHIKVYSEPGIGTTFRIYLPRARQQMKPQPTGEQTSTAIHGEETILVVDDEHDLLTLVEESLTLQGYRVITASHAAEALEKLEQHPEVDLLFSDVVMPGGLNGYELAEKAVKLRPGLKVLLTSGYTETAVARNGQARFNANLLSKPYTQDELARQIRSTLSSGGAD